MSTNPLRYSALCAIALSALAPSPGRAQSYECAGSLGTNCKAALIDAYWRFNTFNVGQTTSSLIVTPGACAPSDAIVDVDLSIEVLHPFVGDLEVSLSHPNGTSTQLLYRPGLGVIEGNCPFDDLAISLDDDDGTAIDEDRCSRTIPAIEGAVTPFNPLSIFDGLPRNGVWTLTVRDHVQGEQGVLLGWTLDLPCVPDLPDINLNASDALVAERGADRTATVTFTRGGDTDGELTVEYVFTGTAALSDFVQPDATTITIPDGESSATLELRAIDDDQVELAETIIVGLLAGDDYEIGPRNTATVTIIEETIPDDGDAGNVDAGPDAGGTGGMGGTGGNPAAGQGGQDAGPGDDPNDDDGCGCRIAGASTGPSPLALGFALAFAAVFFRRRIRG